MLLGVTVDDKPVMLAAIAKELGLPELNSKHCNLMLSVSPHSLWFDLLPLLLAELLSPVGTSSLPV